MSTTALIRITVTLDHCRIAGRSASTTSTPTRREMDEETLATLAMTGRLSTRSRDIEVAGIPVGMAAGVARERSDLGGRWLPLPLIFQDVIPNEVAPRSAVFRGWEPMQPASRGFLVGLRYTHAPGLAIVPPQAQLELIPERRRHPETRRTSAA
jgi:hypothetical protein